MKGMRAPLMPGWRGRCQLGEDDSYEGKMTRTFSCPGILTGNMRRHHVNF